MFSVVVRDDACKWVSRAEILAHNSPGRVSHAFFYETWIPLFTRGSGHCNKHIFLGYFSALLRPPRNPIRISSALASNAEPDLTNNPLSSVNRISIPISLCLEKKSFEHSIDVGIICSFENEIGIRTERIR